LWNDAPISQSRFDPQSDGFLCIAKRFFVRRSMGHAAREFRDVGDECLILAAPENDDFVPILHLQVSPRWYFKMTARTCLTW
jgi:hypothetical protein